MDTMPQPKKTLTDIERDAVLVDAFDRLVWRFVVASFALFGAGFGLGAWLF